MRDTSVGRLACSSLRRQANEQPSPGAGQRRKRGVGPALLCLATAIIIGGSAMCRVGHGVSLEEVYRRADGPGGWLWRAR